MRAFPPALLTAVLVALPLGAQELQLPAELQVPEVVTEDPLVPESTLEAEGAPPENPYYDDRSTAAAVVESFYNAINRGEYLRAFSYFAQDDAVSADQLAADFAEFAAGYETTEYVQLLTGPETSEGAAGSVYYAIPVAIEATDVDGAVETFAGCYSLRLVQPLMQETPPFEPLAIVEGQMEPAEGPIESILPPGCAA